MEEYSSVDMMQATSVDFILGHIRRIRTLVYDPERSHWNYQQLQAIDDELTKTLADIRQHRNCLDIVPGYVGANSLPDEILTLIFECVVQADSVLCTSNIIDIYSAMKVCRRWRHITLHAARIWRNFDFDAIPYVVLSTWLERCSTVPLLVSTSDADCLIRFCSEFPRFGHQVRNITLRKGWYKASKQYGLVNSVTFPNVFAFHMESYPHPDRLYSPPSISTFLHLRVLHTDCRDEFWIQHPFPINLDDLSIRLTNLRELSSLRLADALDRLPLLRRFKLEFEGKVLDKCRRRLRLSALEYVELALDPTYHRDLLEILPTFRTCQYHLAIREPHRLMYPSGQHLIQAELGRILAGHTDSFTTVRFTLGWPLPTMRFEGGARCSISTEEHHPFGPRFADTLRVLHLPTIHQIIISEPVPERAESCYDLGAALSLLDSVERLVIHKSVGQEASTLLTNLGGPGARIIFPTNVRYRNPICWPALSYIDFQHIDGTLFRRTSFEPVQALGLVLWAIKTSGVPLQTVRIPMMHAHLQNFARWKEFISNILVEDSMDVDEVYEWSSDGYSIGSGSFSPSL